MLNSAIPSPVLDELGAAAHAAQQAYGSALEAFVAKRGPTLDGLSLETERKHAREAFERTAKGAELASAYLTTERALRGAKDLGEMITIGGHSWFTRDLSAAGIAAAYRAAAKHGSSVDRWPADVREALMATLNGSPRPPTFGEIAESRRAALTNLRADVDQTLDEHGHDPSRWPIEVLDKLALAQLRIDAFDALALRARSLDSEWATRLVGSEKPGDAVRVERERQEMQANIGHQQNAMLGEVQGLTMQINLARAERDMLARDVSAGRMQPDAEGFAKRDAQIEGLDEQIKAAQAGFARWQSAPDEQKTAIYEQLTSKGA